MADIRQQQPDEVVKGASTAAAAADASLVVALSPNSPVPTGANLIGGATTYGAAKGTTAAAAITSNPVDANTQALHVNLAGTNTVAAVTAITNALPAGANLLGKVGIDQTTVGTTNAVSLAQIGATSVASGNGVAGTGVQRVTVASDNTPFTVNPQTTAAGTALASASRGAGTFTADIVNNTGKGIRVWQDLTVLGATSVVTLTIQEKDPTSGKFFTMLVSASTGAGISAVGTAKLTIYPGLTAAANSVGADVLPQNIRVSVTVQFAASTFSVGYSVIP